MSNDLIPAPKISSDVESYSDPAESFQAEAVWKANTSWAKESNDYAKLLEYFRLWILQRRRTTELIQGVLPGPGAFYGNQFLEGNNGVTKLADFGFTKMQWHRRVKELEVLESVFDSYLDECVEMTKSPSLFGLVRYAGSGSSLAGKSKYQVALEVLAEYQKVPEPDLFPWSDDMKALWGSLHHWISMKRGNK